MTRKERIELAIERGFTYDEITGNIYGVRGKVITRKVNGYIVIAIIDSNKQYHLQGHQFAFYYKYGKVVDCIDHINGIKDDNRIDNLRSVTSQQNQHNRTTAKGYHFDKRVNKYQSYISLNRKNIYLGLFKTEQEARQAYLEAKEKYHLI
jgi:hypothetical protein